MSDLMFAVAFIPDFSLQAVLRHQPELCSRAVALVDPELPRSDIVQLTAAARSCGVTEGMTASQAMARCGDLIIKTRSRLQEDAATEVLLQTAFAFSPNIEATAPGVCTLELKGLGLGGDVGAGQRWAGKLLRALKQFEICGQIGLATTPGLAWLAARSARPILSLRVGDHPARAASRDPHTPFLPTLAPDTAIESFPIDALEPSPEMMGILRRWGIRTIGALLALGRDPLAERLGPEALALFDRVSPEAIRPLKLVVPDETYSEQIGFENSVETTEPLLFVLNRFVEQLSRRLALVYRVASQLHLRLDLLSGANYEHVFRIPAPTGNIQTLFRMLQTHLETVRTDSPIASVRLSATPCNPETHQFGLFETALKDPNRFGETLARLVALCGPDRVGSPVVEPTYRPDAFRMKAPEFENGAAAGILPAVKPRLPARRHAGGSFNAARESAAGIRAAGCQPSTSGGTPDATGLQLRRFRPALAVQAEFRQNRPALLRSSALTAAIAEARGPFLSSGDWWERDAWSREEWDVQAADGALYRMFRSPEGCFVEGVYD